MGMKNLLLLGVVVGVRYIVAGQWPDIQRYMKVRAM